MIEGDKSKNGLDRERELLWSVAIAALEVKEPPLGLSLAIAELDEEVCLNDDLEILLCTGVCDV